MFGGEVQRGEAFFVLCASDHGLVCKFLEVLPPRRWRFSFADHLLGVRSG